MENSRFMNERSFMGCHQNHQEMIHEKQVDPYKEAYNDLTHQFLQKYPSLKLQDIQKATVKNVPILCSGIAEKMMGVHPLCLLLMNMALDK